MSTGAHEITGRVLGWLSKFILVCGIVMALPFPLAYVLKAIFTVIPDVRFSVGSVLAGMAMVPAAVLLAGCFLFPGFSAWWVHHKTGERELQLIVLKAGALRSLPAFALVIASFYFMGAASARWSPAILLGPTIFGIILTAYASYLISSDRASADKDDA